MTPFVRNDTMPVMATNRPTNQPNNQKAKGYVLRKRKTSYLGRLNHSCVRIVQLEYEKES
jgi:hypothetical protein